MGDGGGRPRSAYGGEPYMNGGGGQRGGMEPQMRRERSKSMAAPQQQKPMMQYGTSSLGRGFRDKANERRSSSSLLVHGGDPGGTQFQQG